MSAPADDIFCDDCQHNQTLYTSLLAEFLPDEDDPEYDKYLAAYDEYKVELEERYPQVCKYCLPRVQNQIRNANHVARADNLARIMEASKERRTIVYTSRQTWTLRAISLAKWTYMASTVVGLLWHAAGLIMVPKEDIRDGQIFSWSACAHQALLSRAVDDICVFSPYIVKWLQYAVIADLLTIWWNPKLKLKTNSLTGRMQGLKSLWSIRCAVVILRFASLYYWQHTPIDSDKLQSFRYTHMVMAGVLALSSLLTSTAPHPPSQRQPKSPSSAHPAARRKREEARTILHTPKQISSTAWHIPSPQASKATRNPLQPLHHQRSPNHPTRRAQQTPRRPLPSATPSSTWTSTTWTGPPPKAASPLKRPKSCPTNSPGAQQQQPTNNSLCRPRPSQENPTPSSPAKTQTPSATASPLHPPPRSPQTASPTRGNAPCGRPRSKKACPTSSRSKKTRGPLMMAPKTPNQHMASRAPASPEM